MKKISFVLNGTCAREPIVNSIEQNLPSQDLEGDELLYAVAFRVVKALQDQNIIGPIDYITDEDKVSIELDTIPPYKKNPNKINSYVRRTYIHT